MRLGILNNRLLMTLTCIPVIVLCTRALTSVQVSCSMPSTIACLSSFFFTIRNKFSIGLRSDERGGISNNVAPESLIAFLAALLLYEGSLSITNHFC